MKDLARDNGEERQVQDTWFLDPQAALETAQRTQAVETGEGLRLEICYYDGPPFPEAPVNLIPVPAPRFMEIFADSLLPLPRRVAIPARVKAAAAASIRQAFAEMLAELRTLRERQQRARVFPRATDGYFLDPARAFATAVQALPVDVGHPTIRGRQICYYDGPPIPHAPRGLISLPAEQVAAFLRHTRLRPPQHLVFPETLPAEQRRRHAEVFGRLLQEARADREREATRLIAEAKRRPPPPRGESLRLFFPASRYTQVMQYASRGLARAFEALGHQTWVSIERDAFEQMDTCIRLREYLGFAPQVVVNINHLNNLWLHEDVYNLVWWQDPMPELHTGRPLPVRPRDLLYALPEEKRLLVACGQTGVEIQHHCVDHRLFRPDPSVRREAKIVFVGSSYYGMGTLSRPPPGDPLAAALEDWLESAAPMDRDGLADLARQRGLDDPLKLLNGPLLGLLRERVVEWLCALKGIEVEIYGRGWEGNPRVAPKFKGEVAHGPDLVRLYQGASHALVVSANNLHLTRLGEAAGCGCTPLVFDVRGLVGHPEWEDQAAFFRTPKELAAAFAAGPLGQVEEIADRLSFDRFARRILQRIGV